MISKESMTKECDGLNQGSTFSDPDPNHDDLDDLDDLPFCRVGGRGKRDENVNDFPNVDNNYNGDKGGILEMSNIECGGPVRGNEMTTL